MNVDPLVLFAALAVLIAGRWLWSKLPDRTRGRQTPCCSTTHDHD